LGASIRRSLSPWAATFRAFTARRKLCWKRPWRDFLTSGWKSWNGRPGGGPPPGPTRMDL